MKRLVALIGAVVLVDTMFYAALTPLLPEYADDLGLSKAGAGLLTAMYPIGLIVTGIPAGLAASWLGVKRTLLAGVCGMVVTTALFGFAHSVWLLDVARFLQGAASSCSWTAGLAWLVADAPSESRGRLIGSAIRTAHGLWSVNISPRMQLSASRINGIGSRWDIKEAPGQILRSGADRLIPRVGNKLPQR